jgi:septin family protein
MIETDSGGVLLDKKEISSFSIVDSDDPLSINDYSLNEQENNVPIKENEEKTPKIIVSDEDTEQDAEQGGLNMNEENILDTDKISEKRKTFREKFLEREALGDSWENTIIEKEDKRNKILEDFAQALDKENEILEEFKKDKLGS